MEAYCRLIDQLQEIVRENLQKIQDVSARGPNDLNTAPDVSKRIMMFESDARKIYDNLYKRSDEEDNGCKPCMEEISLLFSDCKRLYPSNE